MPAELVIGVGAFFLGGFVGAVGMALAAMAGRSDRDG
jgi:hypothetical protein